LDSISNFTTQKSLPFSLPLVLVFDVGELEFPPTIKPPSFVAFKANKLSSCSPPIVFCQTTFPVLSN
jgi:hypothetical protein